MGHLTQSRKQQLFCSVIICLLQFFNASNGGLLGGGCRPLNYENIAEDNAVEVITDKVRPLSALANGNDVYISGAGGDGYVSRYNYQESPVEALETEPITTARYMDIYDDFLYVGSSRNNMIYKKPLTGGSFTEVLSVSVPTGIKWSPNGEQLFVTQWNTGRVNVYDKNLERIERFNHCNNRGREISFDSDGNIRISTYSDKICIYERNSFSLLSEVTINDAVRTDGHVQHCDGTLIMADRGGKLHFLNENYETLRTVSGFNSVADVALTTDGMLYVTDWGISRIYIYSLYE